MESHRRQKVKLIGPPPTGAMIKGSKSSKRFHIRNRKSGKVFFVEISGADISLLPVPRDYKLRPSSNKLFAANDSPIDTYNSVYLSLDLGIRRPIDWNFCVTAVPYLMRL